MMAQVPNFFLILGKMPVKGVHLMHGKIIDVLLNKFLWEKVARHIKQHSSPGITRLVNNAYAGNLPGYTGHFGKRINLHRKQLKNDSRCCYKI